MYGLQKIEIKVTVVTVAVKDESAVRIKTVDMFYLTCCHLMNSLRIKQLCLTICGEIIKACDIHIHFLCTAP